MSNEAFRMFELHQQGFNCSQILLQLGLEARGAQNPDLIRAINGLGGGLGFSGKTCGALTGGVCLLSLYTGRGKPEEKVHDQFHSMISKLVNWFEDTVGTAHGSINCRDIIGEDLKTKTINPKCSSIVTSTHEKVKDILESNGISMTGENIE
ncbi:MAG TPA: C_GCAxxG_C_C family protein [Clostridiaceae bacterium]|nr:C_GCAxxG_C_C family protein [Clostridiaceae bacterium]